MDSDTFVSLCERLRALGVTKVSADGWSVEWPQTVRQVVALPQTDRKPQPKPTEDELRELMYARELGEI